ncbi:MAG TPA: YqiA/YcfP family alpha/beta fold hydrolase [Gammaproteobacteria bacterium]|jgi:pimeloyl-ACP methyl ester carboxylesterase
MSGVRVISENVQIYEAETVSNPGFACIAFGGVAKGLGVPVFEFLRTLSQAGISSLFIKDPAQGWYQNPISDIGRDTHAMAQRISTLAAEELAGKHIVTVGNSMGGYAAIAFACLCSFPRAITFSPQTFISHRLRQRYGDNRWQDKIDAIAECQVDDLYPLLARHPVRASIYSGAAHPLDVIHAQHLEDLPGVTVELLPDTAHNVSARLREHGLLDKIILEAGQELAR